MKRIIAILIVACTLLSLVSCDLFKKAPTLNGVKISKYTIVYDAEGLDYNKRAAEYIRDTILERSDIELAIVDDSTPEGENEIVVGETSRPISKELDEKTEGFEFSMLVKGNKIALEGDYFIIAAAAYYFVTTYTLEHGYAGDIPEGVSILEPIVKNADNLIMLIGDGMGVHQTLLHDHVSDTSVYSDKEDIFYGYLFPYQGFSRTASLSGVTDSAAGGTALAAGYKTYNDYVGIDRNGNEIKSLTELAAELGKATAVMSTETSTGATPSTFSAHTKSRDNTSEIMADQVSIYKNYGTKVECGFNYYNNKVEYMEERIFEILDGLGSDEDGFFIMFEEAYIDKKCHDNDVEGTFLALLRFNQAIGCFMEYAFYHPNTAVLITADHETGGLRPGENGKLAYSTDSHTLDDVPVFAWGTGFSHLDGATVENIDIAKAFAAIMGEDNFGDPSNAWYDEIYGNAN